MSITQAQLQKNLARLTPFDKDRLEKLWEIEMQAIARFKGDLGELESALGMLRLGEQLGWKPMVLLHNKRTIRKYEEILGIEVRTFFNEEGPSAERMLGYKVAKQLGNFWKAVSGELKDEDFKEHRRSMGEG